ncbi:hypothetical protein AVEN_235780-1 [Araneus ventricosus]|uniref:Histone-lysine N-methyltransferase SETMAR n=1 Tax=Araneus ventricosus TaxID=182803 RepID=A0A4Y2HLR5_ARAVE|nr:hypothetical protein AVEN_235780-1 [Araneus ventricosus]
MTADMQIDKPPVDGLCPKFDRNLQIMFKDHIPNFIPVALIVFELSCSHRDTHTDRHTDIIPKLCFSDSGRSKTWRSVKISSSNFLTITILSLCILCIRESKKYLSRHSVTTLEHPPYSPDPAPAEFYLFPRLKMELKGHRFVDSDEVIENATKQLKDLSKNEFQECCEQ